MNLPIPTEKDLAGKRVILRADLDVGEEIDREERRLEITINAIKKIAEYSAKLTIIGHRGRPEGRNPPDLSLGPLADILRKKSGKKIGFQEGVGGKESSEKIILLENLRFDEGEEKNSEEFARKLASMGDVYINEAFSVSHREHASIVGLPELLPHFAGWHFGEEVENLKKVLDSPQKPVVFVISGVKDDKLKYFEGLEKRADKILVAGRLSEYIHDESPLRKSPKFVIANLVADKEDITINSIDVFKGEIKKAKTIVVNGPIGRFEDESHRQGTQGLFEAVSKLKAFKVAGGGETEVAIDLLKLRKSFDWISVGGGAMLQFLSSGTLPGIEALIN